MAAKFTVSELAKMMGKPAKEVLFLLQGIGVDVKTVESVIEGGAAQAILTGRTQAPKSLIIRQAPTSATVATVVPKVKTERAALKRIKIVERPPETEGQPVESEIPVAEVEIAPAPAETPVSQQAAAPAEIPQPAPAPAPPPSPVVAAPA
ncbi:MAG: translation initiation factor IF-2 N-terminal domain-containing protein, partial [Thermoanaerobaculia bacterium]